MHRKEHLLRFWRRQNATYPRSVHHCWGRLRGERFGCHDRKAAAISADADQTHMPDNTVQRLKADLDRTNWRRSRGRKGTVCPLCTCKSKLYSCIALTGNIDFFKRKMSHPSIKLKPPGTSELWDAKVCSALKVTRFLCPPVGDVALGKQEAVHRQAKMAMPIWLLSLLVIFVVVLLNMWLFPPLFMSFILPQLNSKRIRNPLLGAPPFSQTHCIKILDFLSQPIVIPSSWFLYCLFS